MNATNYQKQKLKMYSVKFNSSITFQEAEEKINKAEMKLQKDTDLAGDLESSNWFSRWTEDEI